MVLESQRWDESQAGKEHFLAAKDSGKKGQRRHERKGLPCACCTSQPGKGGGNSNTNDLFLRLRAIESGGLEERGGGKSQTAQEEKGEGSLLNSTGGRRKKNRERSGRGKPNR